MKEKRIYREWPIVHLLGPGGVGFFLYMLYQTIRMTPVNGGPVLQVILACCCAAMAIAVGYLYWTGVNGYEPTEEGMKIHRVFRTTFHPWEEFWKIEENRPLSLVIFRSRKGVIAYSSTNFFPDIAVVAAIVHEKSGCRLPG